MVVIKRDPNLIWQPPWRRPIIPRQTKILVIATSVECENVRQVGDRLPRSLQLVSSALIAPAFVGRLDLYTLLDRLCKRR